MALPDITPVLLLVSTGTLASMFSNVGSCENYRNRYVHVVNTSQVNGKYMHRVYVGNNLS
jgi:hypothetical protein